MKKRVKIWSEEAICVPLFTSPNLDSNELGSDLRERDEKIARFVKQKSKIINLEKLLQAKDAHIKSLEHTLQVEGEINGFSIARDQVVDKLRLERQVVLKNVERVNRELGCFTADAITGAHRFIEGNEHMKLRLKIEKLDRTVNEISQLETKIRSFDRVDNQEHPVPLETLTEDPKLKELVTNKTRERALMSLMSVRLPLEEESQKYGRELANVRRTIDQNQNVTKLLDKEKRSYWGAMAFSDPETGWPLVLSRFQIARLLGKGAFGEVYESVEVLTLAKVAIKICSMRNPTTLQLQKNEIAVDYRFT